MLYLIFISHFYISYPNVKEISCFKHIASFISKVHFELQPEDCFINKPKHYDPLIIFKLYRVIHKSVKHVRKLADVTFQ